jgi:hypothetical protein
MRAKIDVTLVARVVFLGETPESESAICFHISDLRSLHQYRLEVLEAALLQLEKKQTKQLKAPVSNQPHRGQRRCRFFVLI